MSTVATKEKFFIDVIKPSHYDDDGYVIQWYRAFVPSNSLGCVFAIADDVRQRQALGENVELVVNAYDEVHTVIRPRQFIRRIEQGGGRGLVLLTGVQSNQFPRAVDLAREFRAAGIQVAIGGFHVSGCLAMLPVIPPDIQEALDLGVTIFAGEAEGRLEQLFTDAYHGRLQPIYNFLDDLPDLEGQVTPFLPPDVAKGSMHFTAFDVGRGCPFRCSFCTIINVQGRKSRSRAADDVESLVRTYAKYGVDRFFITDDNMARNKNWEPIFDRLIELRAEGLKLKLIIQVDTQCHKIPGFIDKAVRAGCNRVFIGMESVSPENLIAAKKFQNRITEYRKMLLAWRAHHVLTHAGYILGFPADTPESIERDIRLMQRELPIDILEFFVLTPLPGSADHKQLWEQGVWMDPDMNKFDSEHVTTHHAKMTGEAWQRAYEQAWHMYYSDEHVETMIRRACVNGAGPSKTAAAVLSYYGSFRFEHLHPLQCGLVRRKIRSSRRAGLPRENALTFYPKRLWETLRTWAGISRYALKLELLRRRVAHDPQAKHYTDLALTAVTADEERKEAAAFAAVAGQQCDSDGCDTHDHDHSHGPKVVQLSNLAVKKPAA